MKISIIVPNYNGEKLIEKNLPKVIAAAEHFIAETKEGVEIVIVDDASTDNSIEEIKNQALKINNPELSIKIIQNKKNLGFSSTVNKGVKESKGLIAVLLNTDVVPVLDFLLPLINHFKDEELFAVGCLDKSIEGNNTILRGRGIGRWTKGFLIHSRGEINKMNTLWVGGGSGAFKKSIWDKLGGLNEIYNPFYWEDIDLSYRALKSGYKILFEPKSIVIHEHEKGTIKQKYSPKKIKTIVYRNQFIFTWLNLTDFNLIIEHILWLPYHFTKALICRNLEFFIGFFTASIKLPKIIKLRINNIKKFVKTDKEINQ